MAKRDYFLIVDTETTQDQLVADFGALIVDKRGNVYSECAVLVRDIYNDSENHPLFYTSGDVDPLWGKSTLPARYERYNSMIDSGVRMLASVAAINNWLAKCMGKYDPILTAYNLSFDMHKCINTGINLQQFNKSFCLWHSAFTKWAHTKQYRNFVLSVHAFNKPTQYQNMSFKTNAETMTRFVTDNPLLEDEPHTAFEDAKLYELPILLKLVNSTKKVNYMNPKPFDWKKVQVKDWFTAK